MKAKCVVTSRNKIIVCSENRKKMTFNNINEKEIEKITVDGCQITNGIKCDYLVRTKEVESDNFVELKGSDVIKGIKQLESTIKQLARKKSRKKAFVISSRVPKIGASITNYKRKFASNLNTELIIKNNAHSIKI